LKGDIPAAVDCKFPWLKALNDIRLLWI
jgi:hypothetical protein